MFRTFPTASSTGQIFKASSGQVLAYLYFEDEPQRQMSMRRLTKDEAYRIARGVTRLPALLMHGEPPRHGR